MDNNIKQLNFFDLAKLNGNNGFRVSSSNPQDGLGFSLGGNFDFNGDKINDIVLSAPYASKVYIIKGQAGGFPAEINVDKLTPSQGITITSEHQYFGGSVSPAGDFDNDGIDDLIVGDTTASCSAGSGGIGYLIRGSSNFPSSFDVSQINGQNGFLICGPSDAKSYFGGAVYGERGARFNHDNFDDIVIGGIGTDNSAGGAYVIFGRASPFPIELYVNNLNGANGITIEGTSGSGLGADVAIGGDFDGDGYDDVVANPLRYYNTPNVSYIIKGGDNVPAVVKVGNIGSNGIEIISNLAQSAFQSVDNADDLNGDGIDDITAGINQLDGGIGNNLIIFGGKSIADQIVFNGSYLSTAGDICTGMPNSSFAIRNIGVSSAGVGDVTGDNQNDLVITSHITYTGSTGFNFDGAIATLIAGPFPSNKVIDIFAGGSNFIDTVHPGEYYVVAKGGDVNNGKYADLIIGAPPTDDHDNYTGTLYVVFGEQFETLLPVDANYN